MCDTKKDSYERPILRDIRHYFCQYCGICRSKKTLITSRINSHHKRPYICTIDDCQASYRRKEHLTRHLLQHKGKIFKCPIENCSCDFAFKGNMTRHVKEFHNKNSTSTGVKSQKQQYVCPEIGCGKVFKFASKLQKHKDSHVKLESIKVVCLYPECMKHFTNVQCLRAHTKSCHQYVTCETCGKKQRKKNIKRHLRKCETGSSSEVFHCEYEGCSCTLSSGDFEEADEQFRSRRRGGRKRKYPSVEMLVRKRVAPPSELQLLMKGIE